MNKNYQNLENYITVNNGASISSVSSEMPKS